MARVSATKQLNLGRARDVTLSRHRWTELPITTTHQHRLDRSYPPVASVPSTWRQIAVSAPPSARTLSFTANMFLAPPAYLATLQNNIRQRPIPWDGAVRSGIITDDQLTRIRAVDRAKKPDTKQSIVEDDIDAYTSLFAGEAGRPSVLESAAKQPPMLQYILVLLGDLIGCMS